MTIQRQLMSKGDTKEGTLSQQRTKINAAYIEKKVNSLSIYNAYWCLCELRLRNNFPPTHILRDDPQCKFQLIRILKEANYTPENLNILLEISAKNSIPLSYVKWIYEDARAALWLYMILKKSNLPSNVIQSETDTLIFIHDFIFNMNLLVVGKELHKASVAYNETLISNKMLVIKNLRRTYLYSKINAKEVKWLNRHNSDLINHAYEYMQKTYDLDNLYMNKENKRINKNWNPNIDKTKHKKALILADDMVFTASDTLSRYNHILASLDYWMFDTDLFSTAETPLKQIRSANRSTFIDNMYAAWNSKTRRVRDKKTKESGLVITSTNKKILKFIAKKEGKTQAQMLNQIIKSYCLNSSHEVILTIQASKKPALSNHVKPYIDIFETAQSIEAKDSVVELVSKVEAINVELAFNSEAHDVNKPLRPILGDTRAIDSIRSKGIHIISGSKAITTSDIFDNDNHHANQKVADEDCPFEANTILMRDRERRLQNWNTD